MTQPPVVCSPRVVVGMTLFNNARHLPDAAASVLSQSHPDFAFVMLDDGSTDDTPGARRLAATSRRTTRKAVYQFLMLTHRAGLR